jgi:hypothetical protein
MAGVQHVLVALWLSACAAATPATAEPPKPTPRAAERAAADRAQKYGLDLPQATHTIDLPEHDAPHVVLSGTKVFVDDTLVDDTRELVALGRLERVDGLFEALKALREARPERVVVFWFDAMAPALAVKSVFQTAAYSGFPNGSFAVRRARTGDVARINADARVPGPPFNGKLATASDPFVLHVESRQGKVQLVWKTGNQVVQTLDVPDGGLPAMIQEQWQRYGGHREASDPHFDQAVLHVDNQARFAAIVGVIDTMYEPQRDYSNEGVVKRVPAMNVTLAVN